MAVDPLQALSIVFLPLFPFSALFVMLVNRLSYVWLRSILFLAWPLAGVFLLGNANVELPQWVMAWALFTAFLYAFRALVIRELTLWLSYIAVSAWAILWVVYDVTDKADWPLFALGFTLPMALMALLAGELKQRFGGAYAGLYGGIAESHPRLSAMLVFTLMAVTATPLFPGFFTMLSSIMAEMHTAPMLSAGLLVVWLLWSWSGVILLQGLVMGERDESMAQQPDLAKSRVGVYGVSLFAMLLFGTTLVAVF